MPNEHIIRRLTGIQQILNGVHCASSSLSVASRGTERQAFIDSFLANVLPPVYRFGKRLSTACASIVSRLLEIPVWKP